MTEESKLQTRARLYAHYASDDLEARGYERYSPEAIGYLLGRIESAYREGYNSRFEEECDRAKANR